MLTEAQFESLLERISINQQDRERLVRIETIVTMNRTSSEACKADVAAKLSVVTAAAEKAHTRIDEQERKQQRAYGILVAIGGVILAVEFILRLVGKM